MTNEELLDKIKAEIEKRIKECEATYPKDKDGYWFPEQEEAHAIAGEYKQLLSFLSTLEEQAKGYDEAYIQSKIAKASETWKGVDVDEYLSQVRGEVRNPIFDECVANVDPEVREEVRENIDFKQALYDHFGQVKDFTLGMRIGKYFYELGCRRTAEKYDEIEYNRQREEEKPMDLDEELNDEIKKYIEEYGYEKGADKLLIAIVARHFAEWQKEQDDRLADIIYQQGIEKGKDEILDNSVMPVPADLAEAAWKYAPDLPSYNIGGGEDLRIAFKDGAKWQKEQNEKDLSEKIAAAYQLGLADKEKQIMDEAVEGRVELPKEDEK